MICICKECGAEIPNAKKTTRKYCDTCLRKKEIDRNHNRRHSLDPEQIRLRNQKKRADLSAKKLDAVVIAAKKAGMSYGEYVARQRMAENKGA